MHPEAWDYNNMAEDEDNMIFNKYSQNANRNNLRLSRMLEEAEEEEDEDTVNFSITQSDHNLSSSNLSKLIKPSSLLKNQLSHHRDPARRSPFRPPTNAKSARGLAKQQLSQTSLNRKGEQEVAKRGGSAQRQDS